jgi:hypothetical protein
LPNAVKAARQGPRGIEMVDVAVKDGNGKLLSSAIPVVTISADGSYSGMEYGHDTAPEIDLIASIEHKLSLGLLTGFVIQGPVPYGRNAIAHAQQADAQSYVQRHPGCHGGPRRAYGLCRPDGLPNRSHQSDRKQGSFPADGLPAEVWQPVSSKRPQQAPSWTPSARPWALTRRSSIRTDPGGRITRRLR